jgi:TonB-dependent receptor
MGVGGLHVQAATDDPSMEEVVVTGIKGSLQQSMDIKRDAQGVVDAISAEDIGAFPDSNLAESLQRITGVSIDRERGEGARVTVRGFGPSFNVVLLNGRQMPTTSDPNFEGGTGRSFDFGNLATEGISSVEVYKSGKADVPTGGIGSTINIKTTRPLDAPGFTATAAASMLQDDSRFSGNENSPELSGLISNTFADDTIGISLSAVRQERESGAATASVGGWRSFTGETDNCWCGLGPSEWGGLPPAGDPNQANRPGAGDIYSVPQNIGYEIADFERTRTNGQATLQWRPQERFTATLDYTYSELELERSYTNLSAWFNFGGQITEFTDGPQASPIMYSELNGGTGDYAMGAGVDGFETENNSTGLNLLWDVTDNLVLEFDYHDSTAERVPGGRLGNSALLSIASFTRNQTTGYFGSEVPVLELDLANPLTADDMIVTGSVFRKDVARMDIEQAEASGSYYFEDSVVESIDFGIQVTEVDNRSAFSVVQRDAWGGVTQPGAISDLLTPASMAGAFDELSGGNDSRLQTQYFTWDTNALIARTEALMASGDATTFQANDMGTCGTGLCASDVFSTDRRTQEESEAVYVQVNMAGTLFDRDASLRIGVRYEETDVASQALAPDYVGINWVGGNELTAIQAPDLTFTDLEGDYDAVLPNIDFRLDVTDNIVLRASYSETLTRPNYADIQGGQTISSLVRIDGGDGNRGNPALLPFESDNIDLSLEWYYGNGSYVAVGYFDKDVENFIGTSSVVENTFGLPHPGLGPLADEARAATGSSDSGDLYAWILANRPDAEGVDAANGVISGVAGRDPASPFNLTVPINVEEASVDGWELVAQHNFGDTGFGVIANATLVDADVGYDDFNLAQQFVLNGLSDSANLVGFYEAENWSVRIAYNWRDEFLNGTGQANVGAGPPTNVAEYYQWDISANYWINDNMQLFFDGLNITDETRHVFGRDESQTLFAVQEGPRYNVGFRYKF